MGGNVRASRASLAVEQEFAGRTIPQTAKGYSGSVSVGKMPHTWASDLYAGVEAVWAIVQRLAATKSRRFR